jgi:hypothetical protein
VVESVEVVDGNVIARSLDEIFNPSYTWEADNGWRWEERSGIYRAEKDGEVLYFSHDPERPYGWGGWEFKVIMLDGSIRDIKGPWSSRAEVVNKYYQDKPALDSDYAPEIAKGVMQKIYN